MYDLAIIGAGPAGLSAAIVAARAGATVIVIDENTEPGGRLLGQLHQEASGSWWIGKDEASTLALQARDAGATLRLATKVWALSPGWVLSLDGAEQIMASNLLVATGAAERAVPIPGWTLPGAMAIGAAQTLTNYYRVFPGQRIAIIGVDPLSLSVASELALCGADVVGIFLPSPGEFSMDRAMPEKVLGYLSSMSAIAPNPLLKFAGKIMQAHAARNLAARLFPRRGVTMLGTRLHLRQAVTQILGEDSVRGIRVHDLTAGGKLAGRSRDIPVDCVCISGGLYPLQELTAGCATGSISELGGTVPLYSRELETSRESLFAAGNTIGIESAKVAMAQGRLAGTSVACRLGLATPEQVDAAVASVEHARQSSEFSFEPQVRVGRQRADALWNAHSDSQAANRQGVL
ncbi:NAD(P)/FAD-dependent oxidoreductase [Glutamicibacter sp. JL.03c]|uniref:NAD(P)/FAD-dependent oxidoreductase n=1 Tax=Glutamicibacter sp. JL.03c TaxID=2984842 RepID=UPI0021F739E0|nr:NAD(P)/FAD-dependent oxidoreductase [Glutamicibacter sp. JL.03c]UYQ76553.1 NAD(P)/FAD-dependent oxidoreductase [Glutamicibacter sp. JL.03c]